MSDEIKPKRRSRKKKVSPFMAAISTVYDALEPLSPQDRYKVMNAVNVLLSETNKTMGDEANAGS